MQKKEATLTLALAIAIFLLGFYFISYIRELICGLLGIAGLWDLPWAPCAYSGGHFFWVLLFLFLIPSIYHVVKKYKVNTYLENALLINSILLPLGFFWRYVDREMGEYSHPDLRYIMSPESFTSLPNAWSPLFLLVSASIIIVALLAIMLKILKKTYNKYLVNTLAFAIGFLFFMQVSIIGSINENYYFYKVGYAITANCIEFAHREVGADTIKKVLSNPETTQKEVWAIEKEIKNKCWECAYKLKEKLPILKGELIHSACMLPMAIISLFFSLKIFRKKRFENVILERGFGLAAFMLWWSGIQNLFYGLEISFFNHYTLDSLFGLLVAFGSLLLIAHLLGYKLKIKK